MPPDNKILIAGLGLLAKEKPSAVRGYIIGSLWSNQITAALWPEKPKAAPFVTPPPPPKAYYVGPPLNSTPLPDNSYKGLSLGRQEAMFMEQARARAIQESQDSYRYHSSADTDDGYGPSAKGILVMGGAGALVAGLFVYGTYIIVTTYSNECIVAAAGTTLSAVSITSDHVRHSKALKVAAPIVGLIATGATIFELASTNVMPEGTLTQFVMNNPGLVLSGFGAIAAGFYSKTIAKAYRAVASPVTDKLREYMVPSAQIERVWAEHNIEQDGDMGMMVHTSFATRNLQNKDIRIAARVYPDGNFEPDFITPSNHLAEASQYFSPSLKYDQLDDFKLFLPYRTLDKVGPGKWNPWFFVEIKERGSSQTLLAQSKWQRFQYDNEPSAEIEKVWVEGDVKRNGEIGMVIHSKFHVDNLEGKKLEVANFFYTDDAVVDKIRTDKSGFKTASGHLCANLPCTSTYRHSKWDDFPVFIPYSALPFKGRGEWPLKFSTHIRDVGANYSTLVRSGWNHFKFRADAQPSGAR